MDQRGGVVDIRIDTLPKGAMVFRIWVDDHEYGDPIDTIGVVIPLGKHTAEVQATHGTLRRQAQHLLGTALAERGFRWIIFDALKAVRVVHYAERISEHGQFYRYRIDVKKAMEKLNE